MGPLDPVLKEIAEAAGVRPPHVFHYLHALSAPGFNPADFAEFSMLEPRHIERIGAEVKKRGLDKKAVTRGTRLTRDFKMPPDWLMWAQGECCWTATSAATVADEFRDYWASKPGKDGAKLDWEATWRNWCRSSRRKPDFEAGSAQSVTTGIEWTPEQRAKYQERVASLYEHIGRGNEAKEIRRGHVRPIGDLLSVIGDSQRESVHVH